MFKNIDELPEGGMGKSQESLFLNFWAFTDDRLI